MNILEVFAQNMRTYRKKAGLTQEKLGQLCGLHRTYIGGIEQRRRNVSIKNVSKIADALGVPPVRLFLEVNEAGGPVFDLENDDNLVDEDTAGDILSGCAVVTWENGDIEIRSISVDERGFATQVLNNLVALGYSGKSLQEKFDEVWPQIQYVYGIKENLSA